MPVTPTVFEVSKWIHHAATDLTNDDLFVVTYAGHGAQLPNRFDEPQEEDGKDETWCLYDAMLRDDQKYWLYSHFKPGVRIIEISDSCHSGTSARLSLARAAVQQDLDRGSASRARGLVGNASLPEGVQTDLQVRSARLLNSDRTFVQVGDSAGMIARVLNEKQAADHYNLKSREYDDPHSDLGDLGVEQKVEAIGLLISGCKDEELSLETMGNKPRGMFTVALEKVMAGANKPNSYRELWDSASDLMPNYQNPNFFPFGEGDSNFLDRTTPFKLA